MAVWTPTATGEIALTRSNLVVSLCSVATLMVPAATASAKATKTSTKKKPRKVKASKAAPAKSKAKATTEQQQKEEAATKKADAVETSDEEGAKDDPVAPAATGKAAAMEGATKAAPPSEPEVAGPSSMSHYLSVGTSILLTSAVVYILSPMLGEKFRKKASTQTPNSDTASGDSSAVTATTAEATATANAPEVAAAAARKAAPEPAARARVQSYRQRQRNASVGSKGSDGPHRLPSVRVGGRVVPIVVEPMTPSHVSRGVSHLEAPEMRGRSRSPGAQQGRVVGGFTQSTSTRLPLRSRGVKSPSPAPGQLSRTNSRTSLVSTTSRRGQHLTTVL